MDNKTPWAKGNFSGGNRSRAIRTATGTRATATPWIILNINKV
jgi:hypothetical protein